MAKQTEKTDFPPLTKNGVTRTPVTATDRTQMLAEGWKLTKADKAPPASSKTDPKS